MERIHAFLPDPLSSPDVLLSAADGDGDVGEEDHISRLPDALLSNIVSRLPVKDGARTAVLSPRWRSVWASTPLVLDDAHLLECGGGGGFLGPYDWPAITAAVSRVLAAHPGPFRCVRLTSTCNYAAYHRDGNLFSRWLRVLAAKAVEELVLVNFAFWPFAATLPAKLLRVASLRCLYLGRWDNFPGTKRLLGGGGAADAFPHLVELGVCSTDIEAKDLDRLLQCSPALETLKLVTIRDTPPSVRVRSRSLRCVLFWMSTAKELAIVVARRLERLVLWNEGPGASLTTIRVKIGYAPELKVIGYLEPGIHVLEIANTVIEAGTKPIPNTMVPSVKILALKVRFRVRQEAKMLPAFLRCFPNVETLHILSAETDEPTGKLNFKFWQDAGPMECLQWHIKRVVFKNFRGERSEIAFLRFILERAQVLQNMVIVLADRDLASQEVVVTKLKPLGCSTKHATRYPKFINIVRNFGSAWSLRKASDLSLNDPFDS